MTPENDVASARHLAEGSMEDLVYVRILETSLRMQMCAAGSRSLLKTRGGGGGAKPKGRTLIVPSTFLRAK